MKLGAARTGRRRLSVVLVVAAASLSTIGCAELFKGPRVVTYTDTSFYIRSIPLLDDSDDVGGIAVQMCEREARQAVLTDSYQDVPIGLRYSTFACL